MSKTDTQTTSTPPLFVAKSDTVVEVSIDDALARIVALREQMAPFEKMEKNLIEVVKGIMKVRNEDKHTTPTGVVAQWISSQESHINKELAKELLGEEWARVHSFKTKRSFKVK
jgi:hypothetical protein